MLSVQIFPVSADEQSNINPHTLTDPRVKALLSKIRHTYSTFETSNAEKFMPSMVMERFKPGEELILTVIVDRYRLGEIVAIKTENDISLGLLGLSEILDFNIASKVQPVIAQGWFISDQNQFTLSKQNDGSLLAMVNDTPYIVPTTDYIESDDYYIEMQMLNTWFGLDYDVDYTSLSLRIYPSQTLPVQARIARKQKQEGQYQSNRNRPVLPLIHDDGYELLSAQTIDAQIGVDYSQDNTTSRYTVLGARDFAYATSEFFIAGTQDDLLSQGRLTLSQQDTTGSLLGPLRATNFQIGDVTGARVGQNVTGSQSLGVRLSNSQIDNSINNEFANLTGEIAPGWDVELYRNGVLLDQRLSVQNGRYEFNDVPLLFGNNDFQLVLYGPQGQIQTERRQYLVDNNQSSGQFSYNVSLERLGESVFGLDDTVNNHATRLNGAYAIPLGDGFSASVGHSNLFDTSTPSNSWNVGGAATLDNRYLLSATFTHSDTNDDKYAISARSIFGQQSVNVSVIGETENNDQIETNMIDATVSGPIMVGNNLSLSHQTRFQSIPYSDSYRLNRFSNSLGIRFPSLSITNNLEWTHLDDPSVLVSESLFGGIGVQKNIGSVFSRLQMRYQLHPNPELLYIDGQFSYSQSDSWRHQLTLSHDITSDLSSASFESIYLHDAFRLASSVGYDTYNQWKLGMNAQFSLGFAPNETIVSRKALATRGTLLVRVFEDDNLNGKYDSGENVLPNVSIDSKQSYSKAITDNKGVGALVSMPVNRRTDIVIDRSSLPDPFMMPATEGFSVIPRQGYLDTIDVPIIMGNEIEGVVYIANNNGSESVAAYTPVVLTDHNGSVVRETLSEYDGYYFFADVPAGNYTLHVHDEHVARKSLRKSPVEYVTLTNEGTLLSGLDFLLETKTTLKGYALNVGQFEKKESMMLYWYYLAKKLPEAIKMHDAFYVKEDGEQPYKLNLSYLISKVEAQTTCDVVRQQSLPCRVTELTVHR